MEIKEYLFNYIAPIFCGLGLGLGILPVLDKSILYFSVWFFFTLTGIVLYFIRANYWEVKYKYKEWTT